MSLRTSRHEVRSLLESGDGSVVAADGNRDDDDAIRSRDAVMMGALNKRVQLKRERRSKIVM